MQSRRSFAPIVPFVCVLAGCSSVAPVGRPPNTLEQGSGLRPDLIHWPAQYKPEDAGFFVHNEIEVNAPPEAVWSELVKAETWPSWYEGAADVKVLGASAGELGPGSSFTWKTMGLDFTSTITEFAPPYRLSWESRKSTIQGYHAWLIIPWGHGCKVVTEESQHGFLTVMQKIFVPRKLHRLHDVWLAQIKSRSESRAVAVR